ncbi:hypothetical protein ACFY00_02125 [Kitasatospora sp. NPDC001540]|uniref:hypothetical protein n=1 Tax=Kitasatospora sp. NPDC001540 TaxID=3364014 RepID=UPI0036878A6B
MGNRLSTAAAGALTVLPVGDRGPEPVAPVPLHLSAATLDTVRFHLRAADGSAAPAVIALGTG